MRHRSGAARDTRLVGLGVVAWLVAIAVGLSPLWSGYYSFALWAPLALGAVVLLAVVALAARPATTRVGIVAGAALVTMLTLSAASLLWSKSREAAWTDTNQLSLYVSIFAIAALAIRERQSARAVAVLLGLPALITSIVVVMAMIIGHSQGAFLTGRLNLPMGYINATAGLLVMGIWPWFGLAETASKPLARAGGLAAAALIGCTAVLTQSRAIMPAALIAGALVLMAAPNRVRRGFHLLILVIAVAVSLHWTLTVYRSSGPVQGLAPSHGVLRAAGLAILAGALLAGSSKLACSLLAAQFPSLGKQRTTRALGRLLVAGAAVAAAGAVIIGGPTLRRSYDSFTQNRVDSTTTNRFISGGGFRYDLWRVAVDEFKQHPLGGLGAGGYDNEYFVLRHNPQSLVVPHSLELQMAAELGIGGILALCVFCGATLAAGFAGRRTLAAHDPTVRIAALGTFAAWLTATSVDWLYNFPGLTGSAMLAAALLVVPGRRERGPSATRHRRGERVVLVVALGCLALLAASIGRQYVASRYASVSKAAIRQSPVDALRQLQTAEQLDPYSLPTLYEIASAYAAHDDYAGAQAALVEAQRREPDNYVPPALLGDLALRHGDYRAARADYTHALRLDPREPALQSALQQARRVK